MLQIWDTCQYLSHDDESVSLGGSFVLSFQSWTLSDLSGLPIPALSLASTNRLSLSSQQMGTGVSKSLLHIFWTYFNNFLLRDYQTDMTGRHRHVCRQRSWPCKEDKDCDVCIINGVACSNSVQRSKGTFHINFEILYKFESLQTQSKQFGGFP